MIEFEQVIKCSYHPTYDSKFKITEEVPGVEEYRWFVPLKIKTKFVLGNKTIELSEYFSCKFPNMEYAKAYIESLGIAEYDIEYFTNDG